MITDDKVTDRETMAIPYLQEQHGHFSESN